MYETLWDSLLFLGLFSYVQKMATFAPLFGVVMVEF